MAMSLPPGLTENGCMVDGVPDYTVDGVPDFTVDGVPDCTVDGVPDSTVDALPDCTVDGQPIMWAELPWELVKSICAELDKEDVSLSSCSDWIGVADRLGLTAGDIEVDFIIKQHNEVIY